MLFLLISLLSFTQIYSPSANPDELLSFWMEAERQVKEGDYAAYAASFHSEAILVNGINGTTIPIQVALDGWKKGFDNTKAGIMSASVEFRFSASFIGESTAHQTGIFLYKWHNVGETPQEVYIHLEVLFTKSSGEWKLLMEYQKAIATKEEWDLLS